MVRLLKESSENTAIYIRNSDSGVANNYHNAYEFRINWNVNKFNNMSELLKYIHSEYKKLNGNKLFYSYKFGCFYNINQKQFNWYLDDERDFLYNHQDFFVIEQAIKVKDEDGSYRKPTEQEAKAFGFEILK